MCVPARPPAAGAAAHGASPLALPPALRSTRRSLAPPRRSTRRPCFRWSAFRLKMSPARPGALFPGLLWCTTARWRRNTWAILSLTRAQTSVFANVGKHRHSADLAAVQAHPDGGGKDGHHVRLLVGLEALGVDVARQVDRQHRDAQDRALDLHLRARRRSAERLRLQAHDRHSVPIACALLRSLCLRPAMTPGPG